MALPMTGEIPARAVNFRRILMGAAVAGVVAAIGLGGFIYMRNNSPHQLAIKAQLAIEQHDPNRAADFLTRALEKHPTGQNGIAVHNLMARAMIDAGREEDARPYIQEVLAEHPDNVESLDLLAETYVHPAFRKFEQAMKPLSPDTVNDLFSTITTNIAALEKLSDSARNEIAQAELHNLYRLILQNELDQAHASLNAAQMAQDNTAIEAARNRLATLSKDSTEVHAATARKLLTSALEKDPKNSHGASLLEEYLYEDRKYDQALAVYQQMKARKAVSQELALTTANVLIADESHDPDRMKRMADAQKVLEDYLAENPKDARVQVAIGQVLIVQNKLDDAAKMAEQANANAPGDLDAQILMVNCELAQQKTADAMNLITPLINGHSNVPQVWYLLGQGDFANADYKGAADAYHKALALNPNYADAKHALLQTEQRSGDAAAAASTAMDILQSERYYMPAWEEEVRTLRKVGQTDRARALLVSLSQDPALPEDRRVQLIPLLLNCGAPDVAQAMLAKLPASNETTALKAQVAAALGQDGQARTLMAKALQENPENRELRLQYAYLLMQANLPADARTQLDTLAKSKLSGDMALMVGQAYLGLRLPVQSAAMAQQVLSQQPKNAAALALAEKSKSLLAGGSTGADGAAATQPSLANVNPDDATSADTIRLANAALNQNDFAQALSLARGGLSKDSGNAELHEVAAQALAGLHQYDQAADEIVAAANASPNAPDAFLAFVRLFPTPELAQTGLRLAGRLVSVNAALGNWAMGRLEEISGKPDQAMHHYQDGILAADRLTDPTKAKEVLYGAVFSLCRTQRDAAGIAKAADQFAKDNDFAISTRLAASSDLLSLGDRAGAEEQMTRATQQIGSAVVPAEAVLRITQGWLNLSRSDRAQALLERQVQNGNANPQVLAAYASLIQQTDPDKSLKIVEKIEQQDPGNPQYHVALAMAQAAAGDYPAAFRTIDDTRAMGETGRQLATTARLRLLTMAGLLKQASDELASHVTPTNDDFASMLAIGEAWEQVNKPQDAEKILSEIPAYAAEYPNAQISLAALETDDGHADAAVKRLETLHGRPGMAELSAGALFHAYIVAGQPEAALELARSQQAQAPTHSAAWRTATLFAAAAAREARQYNVAVDLLQSLDSQYQKDAALDLALLDLLQNKPADAAKPIEMLTDAAPLYNRTTMALLAGTAKPDEGMLSNASASTVYASLAAMAPAERKSALPLVEKNPNLIPGDVDVLMSEIGAGPQADQLLRELAFTQRLLEAGWTTTVLDRLNDMQKSTSGHLPTLALIQQEKAFSNLHRNADAAHVRDLLAARMQQNQNVAPSIRVVLANSAIQEERYSDAMSILQPLESLKRPEILTTLATIHEKLGQLDEAIALHREVRQIDPSNIVAANNLAYTLAAAKPHDKAALAEARKEIQFAIDRAPQVKAFQDTLGWIEILSGQAADGTRRLARAIPALRLDPAVHYHLGMGYAELGESDLARLHLQDVEFLAQKQHNMPELKMATAALKTLASTTTPN